MKKYLLILIIVAAAVVRLLYQVDIWNSPMVDVPIIDSEYYHELAKSLAEGKGGEEGVFFMSPLYPYVLALLYLIFGSYVHVGLIFQALLGVLLVYLIYRIGERLFGQNVGLLSAFFAAFYRPFVYYEGVLLTSVLILVLNALILLLLISPHRTNFRYFAAGLLLGLSALARPNVLLFAAILIVFFIVKSGDGGLRRPAFLLLGLALVLAPVAYRNYQVSGSWVLTTAGAGMNFYAGNNPQAEGIYWEAPFLRSAEPKYENEDYRLEASRRLGRVLSITEASSYWFQQGLSYIVHQPISYLQLLFRKLYLFFHRTEIPNNLSIYAAQDFSKTLRLIPLGFGLIAPLGIAFWFMRARQSDMVIANLYILSYLLATLLFFVASEYRLPVLLMLLPFAAAALASLWNNIKCAQWKAVSRLALLTVLFAVPINASTVFTASLSSPRMDFFNLGSVLQKQERHAEAAGMFNRALIVDPDFAEAHRALGDSYHALKQFDKAAEEFKRAGLVADDELSMLDAEDLFLQAQTQARNGNYSQSLKLFEEGVSLHPDPPAFAYYNMASLNLYLGDTTRAIDELNIAASIEPNDFRTPYTLGLIYENRAEWSLAKDQFLTSLELSGTFHPARIHAALACLEVSDTLQAARLIEPLIGQDLRDTQLTTLAAEIAKRVGF